MAGPSSTVSADRHGPWLTSELSKGRVDLAGCVVPPNISPRVYDDFAGSSTRDRHNPELGSCPSATGTRGNGLLPAVRGTGCFVRFQRMMNRTDGPHLRNVGSKAQVESCLEYAHFIQWRLVREHKLGYPRSRFRRLHTALRPVPSPSEPARRGSRPRERSGTHTT